MLPNDWLIMRDGKEILKARHQEADAYRLAKLAAQAAGRGPAYQRSLVKLGAAMSRAGDYLQAHFGAKPQIETDHILASSAGFTARQGDCP